MMRLGRMIGLAGPILAGACLAGPAAAGTAGLQRYKVNTRGGPVTVERVIYNAGPGEANSLSVTYDGAGVTIRDTAGVAAGSGCSSAGDEEVRCTFGEGLLESDPVSSDLRVSLGDGDDAASVSGEVPAEGGGPSDAIIAGGPGDDRLDAGSVHGVLDGEAGDDVLTAGTRVVEFRGRAGNDRMVGGPEADRFVAGRVRDGRDTMIGGGGVDIASYEARRRGVRADLEGDRDDGARRERDLIAKDVEGVAGGHGADRLLGNEGPNTLVAHDGRDLLVGRGGNDYLDGATSGVQDVIATGGDRIVGGAGADHVAAGAGPDVIDGGRGRDDVFGNAGDDRIDLRNGDLDEAACGDGRDRIRLDRLDYFSNRYGGACEVVRRSRAPVAVFFGRDVRAYADEPAVTAVIGCPGDATAACTGEAEMVVEGRPGGPASFSIAPSEFEQFRVPLDTESWERSRGGETVTGELVLRVRSPDGTVVRLAYAVRIA